MGQATVVGASPDQPNTHLVRRILKYAALGALALVGLRFWIKDAVPYYLNVDLETYGRYWALRPTFTGHIVGGTLALLMGPFQFWSGLKRKSLQVHRWTGRLYLVGVLLGSAASIQLALTSQLGPGWMIGLLTLAAAWLGTSGMALLAIRKRLIQIHKRWMTRSYVVTFSFVSFRLINQNEMAQGYLGDDRWMTLIWASWVVPLMVTEVVFQLRDMIRAKPVGAQG